MAPMSDLFRRALRSDSPVGARTLRIYQTTCAPMEPEAKNAPFACSCIRRLALWGRGATLELPTDRRSVTLARRPSSCLRFSQ